MAECICEWQTECSGTGLIYCDGCGGDLCVCQCGGESECLGCMYCLNDYGDDEVEQDRKEGP